MAVELIVTISIWRATMFTSWRNENPRSPNVVLQSFCPEQALRITTAAVHHWTKIQNRISDWLTLSDSKECHTCSQNVSLMFFPLRCVEGNTRPKTHSKIHIIWSHLHRLTVKECYQTGINCITAMIEQLTQRRGLLCATGLFTVNCIQSLIHKNAKSTKKVSEYWELLWIVCIKW